MQQKAILGESHPASEPETTDKSVPAQAPQQEIGGREGPGSKGLDPTRYGDWEKNGRCIDF